MTDSLTRETREIKYLLIGRLEQVIGLLIQARNKQKEPRLHLIDEARTLLENWKQFEERELYRER